MKKSVIFLKTKNLGDAVISSAAVNSVSPEVSVDVLCFSDCAEIYNMIPRVRHVFSVHRGVRGWQSILDHLRLIRTLRKIGHNYVIQFSDDWRGALLCRIIRPLNSVAYISKRRSSLWIRSFKRVVTPEPGEHAIMRDLRLVRAVSLLDESRKTFHTRLQATRNCANEPTAELRPYVVFQLASRWKFKQLELEQAVRVVKGLIERGFYVLVTGSPADLSLNQTLVDLVAHPRAIVHCTKSITDFASTVVGAVAVVTIDSLALHLAQALNRPVVAIFGPTSDVVWGPISGAYRIVKVGGNFICRPCGRDGCDGSKRSLCLREISAPQILEALDQLLRGETV